LTQFFLSFILLFSSGYVVIFFENIKVLKSDPGAGKQGMGQAGGLIRKIHPAAGLIEEMIRDANAVLPRIRENLPD